MPLLPPPLYKQQHLNFEGSRKYLLAMREKKALITNLKG